MSRAAGGPEPGGATPLRTGIDVRELVADRQTGIGRVLKILLEGLGRSETGIVPVLYGDQRTRLPDSLERLPLRTLREPVTLWWDQVRLPRALREDRIEVFWSPYYKVPLRPPCPVVNTIHDLIPMRYGPWRDRVLFGLACRIHARRAAATLTDSEFSRTCLTRNLGIPPEKIHLVPLAVGPQFRPVDRRNQHAVLSRYSLDPDYLLTVTNFQPHKNLPRLLEAYRQLPSPLRGGHPLVVVGDGAGRPDLEGSRDALGLRTEVRFRALPEVVGDAALLVNPRDPAAITGGLASVLADTALRSDLQARGLARAARFTPEGMLGAVCAALQRVRPRGAS
ncbi:MAG: glycosyltransferase family 4 protein [candidate division NC10 bacterium]|nr:glycosyltransferase family 4 protein [candidate division NC10 bacterium]